MVCFFFFSSRRRHTRCSRDWSSDVCSSDLGAETKCTVKLRADPRAHEIGGLADARAELEAENEGGHANVARHAGKSYDRVVAGERRFVAGRQAELHSCRQAETVGGRRIARADEAKGHSSSRVAKGGAAQVGGRLGGERGD